ncbi:MULTISPECIES: Crp/Fnr family transcriptional regulator [unclassified Halobacteriovorax]|uniref:Crp/Fnr family transcriptional regulator n=3 Tax=Halobacteriovorax TaxID=1652133 RepID=A0ABY0ICZ4_9BACT|nr:Crp/Fnr family transcriptional regulator [Halobacteriovorax vibrionivorans]TGD45722.1 Crp/Fnr family transcriptional regulator [Halobacteriovorax sp. Y22]
MMLEEILKQLPNKLIKDYSKGDPVYSEGEAADLLYIVQEGIFGLYFNTPSGKESFLRVFTKGDIFGHRSYFSNSPYHANAVCLKKGKVLIISREQCDNICLTSPALLKQMTKLMAEELGAAETRLAGMADKSVKRRIVEALTYLKLKNPDHTWTRKEIADFAMSTFESVARVLTELEEQQLIHRDGRRIEIPDEAKLIQFAVENY